MFHCELNPAMNADIISYIVQCVHMARDCTVLVSCSAYNSLYTTRGVSCSMQNLYGILLATYIARQEALLTTQQHDTAMVARMSAAMFRDLGMGISYI